MPSKNDRKEMCDCPVGAFWGDLERTFGKQSNFLDHITRSRIEVLKAIRSLIDERIDGLGNKEAKTNSRKIKNIDVE